MVKSPVAPPSGPELWDELVQAMQYPKAGEPHRPSAIQVRPGDLWESLRPHIEEVGITLAPVEELFARSTFEMSKV